MEVFCNSEHIEHIVSKDEKPLWMFEPLNLCISCSHCNTMKGEKKTLKDFAKNSIVVPVGSIYYEIVHPNFDNYSRHLVLEDQLFIKAITKDKGENTIEICGLWRPIYADRRAKELAISRSDRFTIALARAQRHDITKREADAFLEYVDELLDII